MSLRLYKIRRKGTTDQFSTGGANPRWSTTGKTWTNIGHVKSHLQQVDPPGRGQGPYRYRSSGMDRADYTEAELVVFEVQPVEVTDVAVVLQQVLDKKAAVRRRRDEEARLRREDAEREQLRQLKEKYPDA